LRQPSSVNETWFELVNCAAAVPRPHVRSAAASSIVCAPRGRSNAVTTDLLPENCFLNMFFFTPEIARRLTKHTFGLGRQRPVRFVRIGSAQPRPLLSALFKMAWMPRSLCRGTTLWNRDRSIAQGRCDKPSQKDNYTTFPVDLQSSFRVRYVTVLLRNLGAVLGA
jgi:hypothetical protein